MPPGNDVSLWDNTRRKLRPIQALVAAILAQGIPASEIVKDPKRYGLTRCPSLTTIERWQDRPSFQAQIESEQTLAMDRIRGQTIALIEGWERIAKRVSDGELSPDDPLARYAERMLSRSILPVYVAQASSSPR